MFSGVLYNCSIVSAKTQVVGLGKTSLDKTKTRTGPVNVGCLVGSLHVL